MKRLLLASTALLVAVAAQAADGVHFTHVEKANPREAGKTAADVLSPEIAEVPVATGAMMLENPSDRIAYYGYGSDGPLSPVPGDVQSKVHNVEATKTEPDKNTYLVLDGQKGADETYDYGTHFLFQGHENGPGGGVFGALTRVNLDADEAHRVTLMASEQDNGKPVPTIDGSTFDPFAKVLLLTCEDDDKGGVYAATLDFPSKVTDLSGVMGRAGYEGVQVASDGSVWLVEDVGGKAGETAKNAKQPNSFVYRFVPTDKADLGAGGKLQVLQVVGSDGEAIVFHKDTRDADIMSAGMKALHSYGAALKARWVTIHDTAKDAFAEFDANAAAKAAGGTPFKRPENAQFRPDTGFAEYYFTETGDTNAKTEAGAEFGGFGAVFKLVQASPSADEGTISPVIVGDVEHTGFDNMAFASKDALLVTEDAGDKLHKQRDALDSGWVVDVTADYSKPDVKPVRFLAQGRDAAALLDTEINGGEGFQNDGDNEITGIHVSDGDATVAGLIGTKVPTPFKDGWRVFYTHQHGGNVTYEIVPADPS
ncbi:alkaline phosphatase PhoX [Oharaeibacter diazotrophicus]|uniref:Uncharacterized protein DUF839 n=1 Tax=Oharaeibacter diazotrophicus TaxID=1920512 RepID=A0A4R6RFM1_9HYPH|nr:alkaline phosphatase PhoX [Oharaeibacter diazotrophicus]TDP85060.1 uncharacterized protein DUF839 [Oharaeibacter diazotrophicus]BBE74030.1 hypothetical protein OHA_1_03656 [Pleomorphomonas sp. SM30]GLS76282.1 phosphatase [Oharaeibacter diazotrophicus]